MPAAMMQSSNGEHLHHAQHNLYQPQAQHQFTVQQPGKAIPRLKSA